MSHWIDTFVDEKGLDLEHRFDAYSPNGTWNSIPLGCVVDAIKATTEQERNEIRVTLIKIDFCNGDVLHYFQHLAGALAQDM
jgi:hypothetical protein